MAYEELAWLFFEPDTGLEHFLRILLSCFRARASVPHCSKPQPIFRLVGDGRYDPKDHAVTIVADSCPYSSQVIFYVPIIGQAQEHREMQFYDSSFSVGYTVWGGNMFRRCCKMFSGSSTGRWAVLQLSCCPRKQGGLSENILKNLRNNLPPQTVLNVYLSLTSSEKTNCSRVGCVKLAPAAGPGRGPTWDSRNLSQSPQSCSRSNTDQIN